MFINPSATSKIVFYHCHEKHSILVFNFLFFFTYSVAGQQSTLHLLSLLKFQGFPKKGKKRLVLRPQQDLGSDVNSIVLGAYQSKLLLRVTQRCKLLILQTKDSLRGKNWAHIRYLLILF